MANGESSKLAIELTQTTIGHGGPDHLYLPPIPDAQTAHGRLEQHRLETGQLEGILEDAKYLLHYAVEAGIQVDPDTAGRVITATRLGQAAWDSPDAGEFAAAITKLAAALHPVTAQTLRACREEAAEAIRRFRWIVCILAVIILPLSLISFIGGSISNTITADLKIANDLTVKLHSQFDPSTATGADQPAPPGSLSDLQQFVAEIRAINSRTSQLYRLVPNWLIPSGEWIPNLDAGFNQLLEIKPDLKNSMSAIRTEVNEKTLPYQKIRSWAINVQDGNSVLWGAVSTCVLPVLYALLGACASVLRTFTQQVEARTFAPSYATLARFIIAAIGGGIVGLFNNFSVGPGLSASPLAFAFLVGYSADIFFSFLEGSMQNLGKTKVR